MADSPDTHEVLNQPPPFEDINLFSTDVALQEALVREGAGASAKRLAGFGLVAGSAEAMERARLANDNPPRLFTHDRWGRRGDIVEYHPAYHALMETSCAEGLHSSLWTPGGAQSTPPRAGRHVERAASLYLATQMESGHVCPLSMTNAAVPVLQQVPELAEAWLPKVLSRSYSPQFAPAEDKAAVTIGMAMTEKQGGTDVGANTTRAEPEGERGPGGTYLLTGHKWFMSAPMSDAFFVLAQAEKGLSCFFVPRFRTGGEVNAIRLMRLKDKLGNRSNASSEVEFHGAAGTLVGEEGRGVATIIDMVTYTRLDCAASSAALMRFALASAIHHAEHREVFGKPLAKHPVMEQVLADLALDVEAAVALCFRLARAFDRAADERAAAWRRLMTPVTKYWVCKIAPPLIAECMECHGGNGYVENWPLARIYREGPVNAIWEGSGNVMALDVLRVLQKEPEVVDLVMEEIGQAVGDDQHLKAAHKRLETVLHEPRFLDGRARLLVEGLAVLAAGIILRAHVPAAVADAFIATRMGSAPRQTYGQALEWADTRAIVARASPNRI